MKMSTVICVAVLQITCRLISASEPILVVSNGDVVNPRQPQAAVDEDGGLHLTFGSDNGIYYCQSVDKGKSFYQPVQVADIPKLAIGRRRGPRIVANRGNIIVTAISHESGNLLAWRSSDQGKSWQGPGQVNDSPGNAREGLHAMTISSAGKTCCVWLDLRHGQTQLFCSVSEDFGKTWNENRRVYASPDGTICECCHPAVTYDTEGNIYAMWRNSLDGSRDLYFAFSDDGGTKFGDAAKLGNGTWQLNACPMDGGYLAIDFSGELTTVWRRDKKIYFTDTNQYDEQLLGTGEQPWSAANGNGAYLVWISHRRGDLWLMTPGRRQKIKLSNNASDPVIAASGSENKPVLAAWESGSEKEMCIMAQVVNE